VVLNHFAKGSQIQTYNFVKELHKKFYHKVNWQVSFYCTNKVCYTKY